MARPREDPEQQRKIAVAIFELVAARGVDGASMRAAAAATGLSTGTLNYHFTNKRELVRFALQYAYSTPPDWAQHQDHAAKALARLLRRYVLRREEVRVWWRFFCAMTAHAPRDPELGELQAAMQRELVAFFAGVLEGGVARGELRLSQEASLEAERIVGLAHGLALRQLLDPRPAVVATCRSLLEREIAAICPSRTVVRL